ncbi:MAG: T9SS type A sorting domain-containing protein, partial [Bacteroidota bacterium]
WQLNAAPNTGFFIGNPANDGMATDGIGTKAFGMYATATGYATAKRSFNAGLKVGDEVSFYWAMNWDANEGTKGFDFNAGSTTVLNINNGNFSPAIINATNGDTALRVYGTKPLLVKMKRAGVDLYEFSLTGRDGIETYFTSFNSELIIDGLGFYIGNQKDNNGNRNVYLNNFQITSTGGPLSLATVTTTSVTSITTNSATSGGNITANGGAAVTERGVVWSTALNPTVDLQTKTTNGTGTGSFTANLTGLTPNTTYYVRAYATNSVGTAYGNEISFKTDTIIDTTPKGRVIAFDEASDIAYPDVWDNESNGGSGYGAWNLSSGTGAGFFIGNPANDGMGTDGIGTIAFGMYATGTSYVNARRLFTAPMKVGDELSFFWAMNWDANGGNKGFDLVANDSVKVLNINNSGNSAIVLDTSALSKDTILRNYGNRPMFVTLNRKDENNYLLTITSRATGEPTYTGTIKSSLAINGINLYIGDQRDNNGNRNIFFNKFRITTIDTVNTSTYEFIINKGIKLYPNPVSRGAALQFEIQNLAAGKYTINIYNLAGIRLQQDIFMHGGGKGLQSVRLSDKLVPGVYLAEILGAGRKEHIKVVVE